MCIRDRREDIEIKLDNWSEDILDNSIQISESEMLAYAELVVTDVGNLSLIHISEPTRPY